MAVSPLQGDLQLVSISLDDRSYPIYIAPGILNHAGRLLNSTLKDVERCAVVTSHVVHSTYGSSLAKSLQEAGVDTETILVPEGEESKSWEIAEEVLGELVDLGFDRQSVIIAFGGGSVGDLSGFVAAIYLRGIRFVQVPTTLLAQVDSSIGGKAAVNHTKGKNLIGAFHQPSLVVSDPSLLRTLPNNELLSGFGEIVKYAVIADAELFSILEKKEEEVIGKDLKVLADIITRCCVIKARLVEKDERDTKGLRAALNYGHTVGHALEFLSNFKLRHGEAVSIGMTFEAKISERLGLISNVDTCRQEALLERLGLPAELPDLGPSEIIEAMHRDKKVREGSIRLVLPTGIGTPPTLMAVSDSVIAEVLETSNK